MVVAAHAIDGEEGHNQEGGREGEETRVVGGEHGAKRRWRSEGGAHVCVALVIRCTHLVRRLEIRTGCHERARHCLVPLLTGVVKRCVAPLSGGGGACDRR